MPQLLIEPRRRALQIPQLRLGQSDAALGKPALAPVNVTDTDKEHNCNCDCGCYIRYQHNACTHSKENSKFISGAVFIFPEVHNPTPLTTSRQAQWTDHTIH
jgi:hypothetical protein